MSHPAIRSQKLNGIEAGRGVAALLVLSLHARDHLFKAFGIAPFGEIFAFGHAGVDFFFVLSGFIILHVHDADIGRPQRLMHYLRRRFTRIYPFYWVVLLLTFAAMALGSHAGLLPPIRIVTSTLLLPTFDWPIVGVAWTLQHEVVFYAAFATLILSRPLGIGVVAMWFVLLISGLTRPDLASEPLLGAFNLHFFFGLAAAWLLRRHVIPAPVWILSAGIILFLATGGLEDLAVVVATNNVTHLSYALASLLIILGVVEAERQNRLHAPRLLVALGSASYAIYLTHLLTIGAVWQVLLLLGVSETLPIWLIFLLLFGSAVLGGWLISRFVERPVVTLTRNLTQPRRIESAPTPH